MDQQAESQTHRCSRCGGQMKSSEKHSCGSGEGMKQESLDEWIRARAYELYTARGGEDGHALEDWAQAEKEVRDGTRKADRC